MSSQDESMTNPDDLLGAFLSMGTNDHEALVQQMMDIVSSEDPNSCLFFLEANNWNVQAAIASFYESGNNDIFQQQQHPPQVVLIGDFTIDNKDALMPNAPIRQTWRVKNIGDDRWPYGISLHQVSGHRFPESPRMVPVPALFPGQNADIVVPMRSPHSPGSYASSWRLCCSEGFQMYFGEQMWIIANVVDPNNGAVDDIEQRRLKLEQEHQLDSLTDSFAGFNYSSRNTNQNQPPNDSESGMDM